MNKQYLLAGSLVVAALGITACGGGGSSSTSAKTLAVTPSLGAVTNATVKLYQSDGTTLLGQGDTGSTGQISISYSGSYSGPVIVAVTGDSDAQYYDEAAGTTVAFGPGKLLRAIVPGGSTQTGVTPLTEIAYQLSLVNSITLTDTAVSQINERVRLALAPELTSIISPPALFSSTTTTGSLDNSEAGRYALRLAALAQLGTLGSTPALTVTEQLAWDMADGSLDGQNDGNAISGLLYTPGSFISDIGGHLATMATNFASSTLQAALGGYGAISTSIDVSDIGTGGGDTLPPGVAGQTVTMEYCCAATGSPYNTGDQVLFTFSSSGALTLTDQYTVAATSFTVDSYGQYIWTTASGIKYVLSLSNGAIHEVNVMSASNTFLGQFTPVSSDTGGSTPTPDGAAVGLVNAGFPAPGTSAEIVQNVSGTWDVAIYRAPSNQTDLIGLAKLVISETNGVREIKLTKPDGTVISRAGTDYTYLPAATSFQVYANGAGYIVGLNGSEVSNYLTAAFATNGEITGTAGGFSQIGFRNNISAYGSSVPATFTDLAGTWTGPAGDLTCQPNPLSVAIGATGSVDYQGKWSLSCGLETVSASWDGNDDYVIPTSSGYELAINSLCKGGSGCGGGIIIRVPTLTSPSSITEISTYASGMTGDMNLYNPTRQ